MSQKRSTILTLRLFLRRFVLMKCLGAGALRGREKLSAADFLESELVKKGFRTVDLLSVFVTSDGGDLPIDFSVGDFDLEKMLLEGEIKALAKTDHCLWQDSNIDKNTSRRYNFHLKTVCRELSKLGLCPTGRWMGGKFLRSERRCFSTSRERESPGKNFGESVGVSGRSLKLVLLRRKNVWKKSSRNPLSNDRRIATCIFSGVEKSFRLKGKIAS